MATRDSAFPLTDPNFLNMMMQAQQPMPQYHGVPGNPLMSPPGVPIQNDPYLSMGAMTLGAGLLQNPGVGQNSASILGQAAMQTLNVLNQQRAQDYQRQLEQMKVDQAERGLQLEAQNAAGANELRRSQSRMYDRMPAPTGGAGSSPAEVYIKQMELVRKASTDQYEQDSLNMDSNAFQAKYGAMGLPGLMLQNYRKFFPDEKLTPAILNAVYDEAERTRQLLEAKRNGQQPAGGESGNGGGYTPPPPLGANATPEEVIARQRNIEADQAKRQAARDKYNQERIEVDTAIKKTRELNPEAGVKISKENVYAGGSRTAKGGTQEEAAAHLARLGRLRQKHANDPELRKRIDAAIVEAAKYAGDLRYDEAGIAYTVGPDGVRNYAR